MAMHAPRECAGAAGGSVGRRPAPIDTTVFQLVEGNSPGPRPFCDWGSIAPIQAILLRRVKETNRNGLCVFAHPAMMIVVTVLRKDPIDSEVPWRTAYPLVGMVGRSHDCLARACSQVVSHPRVVPHGGWGSPWSSSAPSMCNAE